MSQASAPISHADRFYIGGQWVMPSSDATISVIDSNTEELYFTVPEAQAADIDRAVSAARDEAAAGRAYEPFSPYRSITFVPENGSGPVTAATRPPPIASEFAERPVHSVRRASPLLVFSTIPPSR
jgi:hypothetical protein